MTPSIATKVVKSIDCGQGAVRAVRYNGKVVCLFTWCQGLFHWMYWFLLIPAIRLTISLMWKSRIWLHRELMSTCRKSVFSSWWKLLFDLWKWQNYQTVECRKRVIDKKVYRSWIGRLGRMWFLRQFTSNIWWIRQDCDVLGCWQWSGKNCSSRVKGHCALNLKLQFKRWKSIWRYPASISLRKVSPRDQAVLE